MIKIEILMEYETKRWRDSKRERERDGGEFNGSQAVCQTV